jgi:hypothetical protein
LRGNRVEANRAGITARALIGILFSEGRNQTKPESGSSLPEYINAIQGHGFDDMILRSIKCSVFADGIAKLPLIQNAENRKKSSRHRFPHRGRADKGRD